MSKIKFEYKKLIKKTDLKGPPGSQTKTYFIPKLTGFLSTERPEIKVCSYPMNIYRLGSETVKF